MTLTLEVPINTRPEARAFLASISSTEPEVVLNTAGGAEKRDAGTLIGLATLVLTIPGSILATLEVKERLERRSIGQALKALKSRLEEADGTARLTFPSGNSVDLTRTSTDAAIDLVIKELGGR